jgi:hypothetical protein
MIYTHIISGGRFSVKIIRESVGTYFVLDENNEKIMERSAFGWQPKLAICRVENMEILQEQTQEQLKLF